MERFHSVTVQVRYREVGLPKQLSVSERVGTWVYIILDINGNTGSVYRILCDGNSEFVKLSVELQLSKH